MARLNTEDVDHWLEAARQCNYRADKLAVREGISQRQLERYTQVLFALSPHAWLTMERMIFAKELLIKLDSIKDVAFALEYKQVSHFSREFKIYYEQTPTQYLKKVLSVAQVLIHSKAKFF